MKNRKHLSVKFKKGIIILCFLSAILLYGCGKNDTLSGQPKEPPLPSEAVVKQTIKEWEELFGAFYDYQGCSAIMTNCTVNNGTVEEMFLLDITYTSGQSDSDEPEHYIADMKASYPEDKPNEITLWQDTSGGAGTGWVLFKECGPD